MATYPAWNAARATWIADKTTPRHYWFLCPACAQRVEVPHDMMPALADRGGLCPRCDAAEQAMYRTAKRDDMLHEG